MTKYLSSIDLKQNQLKNTVIHNLASAPSNPKNGQIYYNTTDKKFCMYENDSWKSYTTLEEIQENYYNKSQIDNMISSAGGFPDQTDNAGKVLTTDGTDASWGYIIDVNNVTESTTENLSKLVINKLTQAEYDELLANNQINDNEIYLTTDDDDVPTKISELENDIGFITATDIESKAETTYVDEQIQNTNNTISSIQTYVNENIYTKEEVDNKILTVYKFKGTVDSENNLPSTAENGDVYNTTDTGMNYAWNGTEWDALGSDVDLSSYLTKEEATNIYALNSDVETLRNTTYTKTEVDDIVSNVDSLPSQADNIGKFLTTNGTDASWDYVINMNNVTEGTNEGLSKLNINKLTLNEYNNLNEQGLINENEFYALTDIGVYTSSEVDELINGLSIPTKTSELTNDSGFITEIPSEYITETELNDYVNLSSDQTIPGNKTFTGTTSVSNLNITGLTTTTQDIKRTVDLDVKTPPTSNKYIVPFTVDNGDESLKAYQQIAYFPNGILQNTFGLRRNVNGTNIFNTINLDIDSAGNKTVHVTTPESTSNGQNIATTAWVNTFCKTTNKIVTEWSGNNANSWYRKWSNGFIEQGGIITGTISGNNYTVSKTFYKPFTSIPCLTVNFLSTQGNGYNSMRSLSATAFSFATLSAGNNYQENSYGVAWYACGF